MQIAAAVVSAVILSSTAGFAQQTPTQRESPIAHKTYVLSGCLVMSGASPAPTFELRDATAVGQAPPTATEVRPVPTAGQKLTYKLKPETGVTDAGVREEQLKMHAGQRVQVTVREEEAVAPAPQRSAQATSAPVERPTPQDYTVTEIKLVSGSCL